MENSIKKWLTEESNCCPICRFELKFKEIENSEERVRSFERNEERRRRRDENNETIDLNNYDIALQEILLNSYSSNTTR